MCAYMCASVGALALIARRRVAIDGLAFEQVALEVRGYEVIATHLHARIGREVGEHAQGGAAHSAAPSLIVIDTWYLSDP